MQFDAELLLLAMAPVFLACIGWEAWHLRRTRPGAQLYSWRDTFCNAALALMQQAADKLAWLAIIPVYAFFYDHYRVTTWQANWVSFVVLFVAQDLLYYCVSPLQPSRALAVGRACRASLVGADEFFDRVPPEPDVSDCRHVAVLDSARRARLSAEADRRRSC